MPELVHFGRRHLQAHQDAPHIAALIAVMEQRDIPVRRHAVQEAHQRARPFRELETIQQFVMGQRTFAADQMADMQLGQLVTGQVERLVAVLFKRARQHPGLAAAAHLQADKHMRFAGIADAVIELGHVARTDQAAETAEAATLLGHGHGKHGLARFAQLGALGHETQAVEVHVRAAGHGHQRLALDRLAVHLRALDIGLGAGHGQRAGRFQDAARVLEHVLDRRADRIGIDQDDLVDHQLRDAEGFFAHQAHRGAVREQADVVQGDAVAGLEAARHRVRIERLHADDLDVRADFFHIGADARDQAAAADGDENRMDRAGMLAQDFHANRALAGDHVRIVERVHEGHALFFFQQQGVVVGVGVRVAMQHDLDAGAAARFDRLDFQGRGGRGHHDQRAAAEAAGRQRHALGVVAGRGADHAARTLLRRQVRHLVVGAAQLEAEHALHVFALEVNAVAHARRQRRGQVERGLFGDVVDAGGQDFLEIVGSHGRIKKSGRWGWRDGRRELFR